MAPCGVPRIDQLLQGQAAASIGPGETDREAVGVVQDFFLGHGFKSLPGVLGKARGQFGPKTTQATREFQGQQNLPQTGAVDQATLRRMIDVPASRPLASRGYLTLVLDFLFDGMTRVMSLTTQFEGAGLFGAINRNTDKAGLSFGLIQWAQKPGRLNELLAAFHTAQPQLFVQIFGVGDQDVARGLLTHTAKPMGGVDKDGQTTAPAFDLVSDVWVNRFRTAALDREFQKIQVQTALDAFGKSFRELRNFAPQIQSERGIAFMLDLANQHGDAGAKNIFTKVVRAGMTEAEAFQAMEEESVARVRAQFKSHPKRDDIVASTQGRRQAFRSSALLSDNPFHPG